MRIKLTIQNGHRNAPNGQTGTSGEVDLVDKVYYALKSIIDSKYSDIIELSYDDATVKNGVVADYFIALHFDGSTNPNYQGGFVDDCPKCTGKNDPAPCDWNGDQSWKFAQTIADYYFGPMGIKFEPGHRTNASTYYYAFNFTGEKTIQTIIELGTLTNSDDKVKCQDYNKIARLLMEGIITYFTNFDVKYQEYLKNQPTTPPQATTGGLQQENEKLKQKVDDLTKTNKTLQDQLTAFQNSCNVQLSDKDKACQEKISQTKKNVIDQLNKLISSLA